MPRWSSVALSFGFLVLVVYLFSSSSLLVGAWPGGSAMYECCCPERYGCRSNCFMCRNDNYVCNCDLCSCYMDSEVEDVNSGISNNDLLSMLLRNGAGRKSRNWRYGSGR